MPGMKYGWNLETCLERYLSSWKSEEDPAEGEYAAKVDLRGYPQTIMLNESVKEYTSKLSHLVNQMRLYEISDEFIFLSKIFDGNINPSEISDGSISVGNFPSEIYIFLVSGGSGCLLWFNNLVDMRKFSQWGQDLYIRVPASELAGYEVEGYSLNQVLGKVRGSLRIVGGRTPQLTWLMHAKVVVSPYPAVLYLTVDLDFQVCRGKPVPNYAIPDGGSGLPIVGYISPEYAARGHFSVKSDVFSYGVIILEFVSGKKNREFSNPEHYNNLLGHVHGFYTEIDVTSEANFSLENHNQGSVIELSITSLDAR
uniref:Serine/threonine-protein kinase receptor n=1 Tax=Cajanus cajan TaxID=3821 RepID=A0A151RJN3_CAJCA|nr:Putative serine/threonine-protein kinase receptor [Cajanus cajan]